MKLKLVKLEKKYRELLNEMMEEWSKDIETNKVPWAIFKNDYQNFDHYLENIEMSNPPSGYVPDSTFFCLDLENNSFVGAINIRHYLNEKLLVDGGHIGDGVRPSRRREGIATEMIRLALEECEKLGIYDVLMVCNKNNIGSAKSILKNGGILENEINVNGNIEQRYWIHI